MLVKRIMRQPVTVVARETSMRAAAALMAELNIGALPVCDSERLVGILTDRDIVIRCASRHVMDCRVSDIMTRRVITCLGDQAIADAVQLMADNQVRRLVVLDRFGKVVGMLTLGDIALDANEEMAGQALGEIVELR